MGGLLTSIGRAFQGRASLLSENSDLRKRNERLVAMMNDTLGEVQLVDMKAGLSSPKGGLEIDIMAGPIPYIVEYLFQMMRLGKGDGKPSNYIESQFTAHHRSGENYVLSIQRVQGQTPHEKAEEAINRAEVAERALERLVAEREAGGVST